MGIVTGRLPGRPVEAGSVAYRATLRRWFDVTVGPGPLAGPPAVPGPGGPERGSLAAVVRRMAVLARHDARWARWTPSVLAVGTVAAVLTGLLRRHPPSVAVLVTAVAFACPVIVLPLASGIPALARRAAAVGPRPLPGRGPSVAATLVTAVLVATVYVVGRGLAAGLVWPEATLGGFGQPVLPEAAMPPDAVMTPLEGVGAGMALGAVLTLGSVAAGVALAVAGTVVRRLRERTDLVVALAAPAVEALDVLPLASSPLDPEDKAAVLRPMRRLAANLEVALPRLLPVSGRREQRDLQLLSTCAARAVRSWEPLVVASNPDRVRMLRVNLEAVLAAALNGDYGDLPVVRDPGSGLRRNCWTAVARRAATLALPLGPVAAALAVPGGPLAVTAGGGDALRAFGVAWCVLGILMAVDTAVA